MRNLCILGSTGSIGENTLDVVRQHPDQFSVISLTANSQVEKLAKQCIEFRPQMAVVGNVALVDPLKKLIGNLKIEIYHGPNGLLSAVQSSSVDTVMASIVGAAGLLPTLEAAKLGKRVLLANKEALVMSGELMMNLVKSSGAELLPIDSEHNAIFQCIPPSSYLDSSESIQEILLTASGGPFLQRELNTFDTITPQEACKHPNWVMGRKISVDSATMMNKGLELIEAMWLFNTAPEKIKVVIHPQSTIHSMVRFIDGSVIAQLGSPDMRIPIAYGLAWPKRISTGVKPLEFDETTNLKFHPLDYQRYPILKIARQVASQGGTAPTMMNAANEVAVEYFLNEKIKFTQIFELVESVLNKHVIYPVKNLDSVLEADKIARLSTLDLIQSLP